MRKINLNSESGFTLIETVIAVSILSVAFVAFFLMQLQSIKSNRKSEHLTQAVTWNSDQVEKNIGVSFATLLDTDADGIAGLDDATNVTADGNAASVDGRYSIYWNVAEDEPITNTKTISTIVVDNQQTLSKPVTFSYIKADIN